MGLIGFTRVLTADIRKKRKDRREKPRKKETKAEEGENKGEASEIPRFPFWGGIENI